MRYAILTLGRAANFEACRLLRESTQRFVSGDFRQYWVVEARHADRFRPLAGARSEVLTVESIVPRRIRWQMAWAPDVARDGVVRLSAASLIDADAFLLAGPGVAFVGPFDLAALEQTGRLRLYRAIGEARQFPHIRWHRAASRLLGLPSADYFGANYAVDLATWRKDSLERLQTRIEQTAGKPWLHALSASGEFADTILYGIFADHFETALHAQNESTLYHDGWSYNLATDPGVRRFLDDRDPGRSAIRFPADSTTVIDHCRRLIGAPTLHHGTLAGASPRALRTRSAPTPHANSSASTSAANPS